jgi:hypothetical protein
VPTRSRWDETHTRQDVPTHALRMHAATDGDRPDNGDEPPELEQLRWARWVLAEAAQLVECAIIEARQAGATWETIGAIHGVTRQAAQQRWAHLDRA